jgi:hypothetical protein
MLQSRQRVQAIIGRLSENNGLGAVTEGREGVDVARSHSKMATTGDPLTASTPIRIAELRLTCVP